MTVSRIIIKCQKVKTDKNQDRDFNYVVLTLALQSRESDNKKILSLSPIQVFTRQYRPNKTTCIKATPL